MPPRFAKIVLSAMLAGLVGATSYFTTSYLLQEKETLMDVLRRSERPLWELIPKGGVDADEKGDDGRPELGPGRRLMWMDCGASC